MMTKPTKFCHYCEMGFFMKSHLHGESCRFFVRAVKAVKRKREEEPKAKPCLAKPKEKTTDFSTVCFVPYSAPKRVRVQSKMGRARRRLFHC